MTHWIEDVAADVGRELVSLPPRGSLPSRWTDLQWDCTHSLLGWRLSAGLCPSLPSKKVFFYIFPVWLGRKRRVWDSPCWAPLLDITTSSGTDALLWSGGARAVVGRPASCGARRRGKSRLYSHRSQAEEDKQPAREDTFGECAAERVRGLQNASCCPGLRGEAAQDRLCVLTSLGAGRLVCFWKPVSTGRSACQLGLSTQLFNQCCSGK